MPGRAAAKVNPASGHFHDEQQVERDQTTFRPDFDGREVDRPQHVRKGFEKRGPGCLALALRRRIDAVFLEDITRFDRRCWGPSSLVHLEFGRIPNSDSLSPSEPQAACSVRQVSWQR